MELIMAIALLCQVHPDLHEITSEGYRSDLRQIVCQDWMINCVDRWVVKVRISWKCESEHADEVYALKMCIRERANLKGGMGGVK